ncbi:MAG TPA: LuxR family transcriptional regulator [Candidatus Kapabacteria bacterium]|nr:LuxR family transcriptional regulator [Candidatus Kapabacteria bacterium]
MKKHRIPRKRIYFLLGQIDNLVYLDIGAAIKIALQSIEEAAHSGESDLKAECELMAGKVLRMSGSAFTEASKHLGNALKIFKQLNDSDAVCDAESQIAFAQVEGGNGKIAMLPLHRLLHIRTAELQQKESIACRQWSDRLIRKTPSRQQMRKNLQRKIGMIYEMIAYAFSEMGDNEKAFSNIQRSLALWRSADDRLLVARALNDIGLYHIRASKGGSAIPYFTKSLAINRQLGLDSQIATNEGNLARLYFRAKKPARARRLMTDAISIWKETGLHDRAAYALAQFADEERALGFPNKAQKLISESLDLLKGSKQGRTYINTLHVQYYLELETKPSRAVYEKFVKLYHLAVKKKLDRQYWLAREVRDTAERLNMHAETIFWLKKVHEYELHRIGIEQEEKIARLETEQQISRLEYEREMNSIRTRQLESDLRSKTHEIELLATQLAKKGSFVASLTGQLANIRSNNDPHPMVSVAAVTEMIEAMRFKDKEYEQLEERAKTLYHDFFLMLAATYPDLTQAERKVCVLLKLGLNSKDIANVLFTSVRTIENHSLAIRKKLGISGSTRLSKFILGLGAPKKVSK